VRLPVEKAEKLKSGGIFYSTGFQLKPGEYKLKFLVRDNGTGKLGGFEQPVSVPALDLKKLDTSSIVLGSQLMNARSDSQQGVAHQGMMRRFQEMGISYDPLVIGNRRVVPSIGNIFSNRQTVYVFFQVYGAAPDEQTQKPWIATYLSLLKDDTKIMESQPEMVLDWTKETAMPGGMGGRGGGMGSPGGMGAPMPGGGRGDRGGGAMPEGGRGARGGTMPQEDRKGEATVAISLPLKSLKKGTYVLQIHVRDLNADANIFRRVPIVIQ
jgi:hypothetical protein